MNLLNLQKNWQLASVCEPTKSSKKPANGFSMENLKSSKNRQLASVCESTKSSKRPVNGFSMEN